MSASAVELPDDLEMPEDYRLARIQMKYLDHFPGNVRQDLHLTTEYCASLKEEQQVVITVVPIPADYKPDPDNPDVNPEARFWVTKGNRRFGGFRKIGRDKPLCLIDLTKADKQALIYIDQVVENDEDYRRPLTVFEKNQALALAFDAGASRTEIRRRTGRSRKEISDALAAGGLSEQTRRTAQTMDYAWTTEELALLTEFDGDEDATARIQIMVDQWGHNPAYAIQVLREERAEAAAQAKAHAEACAALELAGIPVTEHQPAGAMLLHVLAREVDGFDPEAHHDCPGRGAFFYSWRPEEPELYCSTPDEHGYAPPVAQPSSPVSLSSTSAAADTVRPRDDGPSRRIVVEGNRAWKAAGTVRQAWLTAFLSRKSAPKCVQRFVTRMLNTMPAALCDELGHAKNSTTYRKLGGPMDLDAALATAAAGRMAMLQLLPIAAAFEYRMTEASEECKNTWREGRYSPCSVADATVWLRFLVQELGPELGDKAYDPAPIERSLIDGVPYRGDAPGQDSIVTGPENEAADTVPVDTFPADAVGTGESGADIPVVVSGQEPVETEREMEIEAEPDGVDPEALDRAAIIAEEATILAEVLAEPPADADAGTDAEEAAHPDPTDPAADAIAA
ncbi:hypothetical protein [Nonomuraea wenchangensis]|uniref:hypothetical protein n=1 Tax=Nonomuraea wenchangensis TaxID=568860 RepID=UPI003326A764